MSITFGVRGSKEDTTKTVFVCMDEVQDIMDKMPTDKVQEYFKYGFAVAMQAMARKKSPDAVVAHLALSEVQCDYDEGVEVQKTDTLAAQVKGADDEKRKAIEAILAQ